MKGAEGSLKTFVVVVIVVQDSLHKTRPLTALGFSAEDMQRDAGLLTPDDSLASHSSLVSMAVYPSGQTIPHNVTTLLVSGRTTLDENVAASLLPAASNCDSTTYRVKKLRPSSEDTAVNLPPTLP